MNLYMPGIPGVHYDASHDAQELRRQRLTYEAIRERFAAAENLEDLEHAALNLVSLTGYLNCPPGERVEYVDRILTLLGEAVPKFHLVA